jgi:nucleotide-binding universal stress UspA family protein
MSIWRRAIDHLTRRISNRFAPAQTILNLSVAYWSSRCLHVVADAGIADVLEDEPQTAEVLASRTGLHAEALRRVLRTLSSRGVFNYDGERFSHNAASRVLRSDTPGSMRPLARMMGLKVHWDAYRELGVSLRDGTSAIKAVTPDGLFPYLQEHPDQARIFHDAMAAKSTALVPPVARAYDYTAFETIGDIGGGLGHLIAGVLEQAPKARGVLFDLPEVIEQARQHPHPRVTYAGGNFFSDPIPACNAYLMMTVLHDWSDDEVVAILANVLKHAPRTAKLLIIEGIVRPEASGNFVKDLDIEMLVMTTGRERTADEWRAVLERGGFELSRIIPALTWASIIEARPMSYR